MEKEGPRLAFLPLLSDFQSQKGTAGEGLGVRETTQPCITERETEAERLGMRLPSGHIAGRNIGLRQKGSLGRFYQLYPHLREGFRGPHGQLPQARKKKEPGHLA